VEGLSKKAGKVRGLDGLLGMIHKWYAVLKVRIMIKIFKLSDYSSWKAFFMFIFTIVCTFFWNHFIIRKDSAYKFSYYNRKL
ncbi:hypothetical protein SAMN05216349_1792, partial [Oribacterium sp. KHPX15]